MAGPGAFDDRIESPIIDRPVGESTRRLPFLRGLPTDRELLIRLRRAKGSSEDHRRAAVLVDLALEREPDLPRHRLGGQVVRPDDRNEVPAPGINPGGRSRREGVSPRS